MEKKCKNLSPLLRDFGFILNVDHEFHTERLEVRLRMCADVLVRHIVDDKGAIHFISKKKKTSQRIFNPIWSENFKTDVTVFEADKKWLRLL